MSTQREKAEQFRALHRTGRPIVLVNAWDAVSARILESLGFDAVATTSAGIAFLEGFPDGQHIGRDVMLAGVARIARAVSLPVTADLEGGYGPTIDDAIATARGAIEAGAIGLNFEDGFEGTDEVLEAPLQAERIRAIRRTGDELGIPLVINARTDIFLHEIGPEDGRMKEVIERGNLYHAAGADCVFVPGLADKQTIETLVKNIPAPINVLVGADSPSVDELRRIGVARVSLGSRPHAHALAAFRDAAIDVRNRGTFALIARGISYAEVNALFA